LLCGCGPADDGTTHAPPPSMTGQTEVDATVLVPATPAVVSVLDGGDLVIPGASPTISAPATVLPFYDASACPDAEPAPLSLCSAPGLFCPYPGDGGSEHLDMECEYQPGITLTEVWQPVPVLDRNACVGPDGGMPVADDAGVPCEQRPTVPCNVTGLTDTQQVELDTQLSALWQPGSGGGGGVEIDFADGCAIAVSAPFGLLTYPNLPSSIANQRFACAIGLLCGVVPAHTIVSEVVVRDF
jgi:hypothetical protein